MIMAGSWASLKNQPKFNTSTMILLTDGRVMVQEEQTAHWHALTPDSQGSYINGQWSSLSDMAFWRRYYASGVLRDGRVFICGGEQNGDIPASEESNKGEIYDPEHDSWTSIQTPPWKQVGDAASIVLPDGKIIVGDIHSGDCLIYDPTANSWSPTGSQSGRTSESTWILLPNETILAPQCFAPFRSQRYTISSGAWQDEGPLPVTIVDSATSEMGPGMLMYNGSVIFFGAANSNGKGKTAIYVPPANAANQGNWKAGPDIPIVNKKTMVCNDCPAALLPNGKVLFTAANFVAKSWGSPVYFFEYDPAANTIVSAPTPPNSNTYPYPQDPGIYWSRLMVLPTGQVLFSASSNNIQAYTPDGGPQASWKPKVTTVKLTSSANDPFGELTGTQLNGLSQANVYGDDCYPATNYPLVQLRNIASSAVMYCRTFGMSTMGVATGASPHQCCFSLANVSSGKYELRVVANGIASDPYALNYAATSQPIVASLSTTTSTGMSGPISPAGGPDPTVPSETPSVDQLVMRIKYLDNAVQRLNAIAAGLKPKAPGKDVAKKFKSYKASKAKPKSSATKSRKAKKKTQRVPRGTE
jgi:hypothetical protein